MSDTDRDAAMAGAVFLGFIGMIALLAGVWLMFGIGWALVAIGAVCTVDSWLMGLGRKRSDTLLFANTNN